MQEILKLLNLRLLRELSGKTKSVYLVGNDQDSFVLKVGTSPQSNRLLQKEIAVTTLLNESIQVVPRIFEEGVVNNNRFLLQEYFDFQNFNEIAGISTLKEAYRALAATLLKFAEIMRDDCGEVETGSQYSSWSTYLTHKIDDYYSNLKTETQVLLPNEFVSALKAQVIQLSEPLHFNFLHMDLHGGNIFLSPDHTIKLIDFDESIFGDTEYELTRLLQAHFTDEETGPLRKYFLQLLGRDHFMQTYKYQMYKKIRILHYIAVLDRRAEMDEIQEQVGLLRNDA